METRLRMLLVVLAGLPEPVVDFRVRDSAGTVIRRFDLSYPAWKATGLPTYFDDEWRPHFPVHQPVRRSA